MDPVLRLEPKGNKNVNVGGFCVATRPLEYSLEIWAIPDFVGGLIMEIGIVDDAGRTILIHLGNIVREIVFAEFVIMGKEMFDAAVFFFPGLITVSKPGH